jgi:hypothetical protein
MKTEYVSFLLRRKTKKNTKFNNNISLKIKRMAKIINNYLFSMNYKKIRILTFIVFANNYL